jgi:tryptophan synthase alpha chain
MWTNAWKTLPPKSLIPYITFADPSIEFSMAAIETCLENGADAIEIGIPFSDPIADGPVIQKSHQRALQFHPTLSFSAVFSGVKQLKTKYTQPIILMSAVNLIYHWGVERFFKEASAHGVDGVVIPDLSIEEASPFLEYGRRYQVAVSLLVSSLCSEERLRKIVKQTQGFLYLISSTGITGERNQVASNLAPFTEKIKRIRPNIPVWVGFGISQPEHVSTVWSFSEGAIIGSFFVNLLEKHHHSEHALDELGKAVRHFKGSK